MTTQKKIATRFDNRTPGEWNHDQCGPTWILANHPDENDDREIYLATIVDEDSEELIEHDYDARSENADLMASAPFLLEKLLEGIAAARDVVFAVAHGDSIAEHVKELEAWADMAHASVL